MADTNSNSPPLTPVSFHPLRHRLLPPHHQIWFPMESTTVSTLRRSSSALIRSVHLTRATRPTASCPAPPPYLPRSHLWLPNVSRRHLPFQLQRTLAGDSRSRYHRRPLPSHSLLSSRCHAYSRYYYLSSF
ncbi:hypothetical protein TEA_024895 [Camellia sinensis var. sinensis]|uniref:Uncharacterized protein n=1 Tax=Camellia sinensis var. sinensis TaxID=542762 RepID=A0A4V3WL37_CAMSN|nr:hypothetical protein TEA_024895 [Camellia sinensis var. sinensis]